MQAAAMTAESLARDDVDDMRILFGGPPVEELRTRTDTISPQNSGFAIQTWQFLRIKHVRGPSMIREAASSAQR
jgi:hypothetical protein